MVESMVQLGIHPGFDTRVFNVAKYRLMDKLTCVQCGKFWYQPAVGKSSRSFNVQCDPECEGRVLNVPEADVQAGKSKELPKGR